MRTQRLDFHTEGPTGCPVPLTPSSCPPQQQSLEFLVCSFGASRYYTLCLKSKKGQKTLGTREAGTQQCQPSQKGNVRKPEAQDSADVGGNSYGEHGSNITCFVVPTAFTRKKAAVSYTESCWREAESEFKQSGTLVSHQGNRDSLTVDWIHPSSQNASVTSGTWAR